MKKLLIATDSFKGSLSSIEIGEIFKSVNPDTKIISVSDGGEGFVESILWNLDDSRKESIDTVDDMLKPISVNFAIKGKHAYIDVASVVQLHNYPEISASKKTSYGVGKLLKEIDSSYDIDVINIGLGGSSTNDGGFGAAIGLGFKFYDKENNEITDFNESSNIESFTKPDFSAKLVAFSDVENELLGSEGATMVYGTQKWLSDAELSQTETAMRHFANATRADHTFKGAGAAGGLGFFVGGLMNGEIKSGIDEIIKLSNLEELSKEYDYLVTGEGKFDIQSTYGKAPYVIAKKSRTRNILIAGLINMDTNLLSDTFEKTFQVMRDGESIEDSMKNTPDRLQQIAIEISNL